PALGRLRPRPRGVRADAPAAEQPPSRDPRGAGRAGRAAVLGRVVPRCRRGDRRRTTPAPRRSRGPARPGPRRDRAGGSRRGPADDLLRDERAGAQRRAHLVRRIADLPQAFVTTTTLEDLDPALVAAATAWEVVPGGDAGASLRPLRRGSRNADASATGIPS